MRNRNMRTSLPPFRHAALAAALLAGMAGQPAHGQAMSDHAGMDHGSMPGMDHSSMPGMDHGSPASAAPPVGSLPSSDGAGQRGYDSYGIHPHMKMCIRDS